MVSPMAALLEMAAVKPSATKMKSQIKPAAEAHRKPTAMPARADREGRLDMVELDQVAGAGGRGGISGEV